MGEAVGQVLPFAVVAAISPLPIIAVILMLVTSRARINGPAYIVGWLIGLAVIGILVIGVAGGIGATSDGETATWVIVLQAILGILLVVLAVRQFRGRPQAGEDPDLPAWMGAIDGFTGGKALGAGAAMSGINPKNLLLSVGAAATIAQTGIPPDEQAVAYLVFALIASIGVATPVVIFFALGDRAPALLDQIRSWMGHNNAVIMTVVCLVIGAVLIGRALGGMTS